MLGLAETLLFYLLAGVGVGAAVWLRDDALSSGERLFRVLTAVLFWPLYVPALLQSVPESDAPTAKGAAATRQTRPRDDMDAAIEQVEAELDAALKSLDGWAEGVLARENARFDELGATWRAQADRIRELDSLLKQPQFASAADTAGAGEEWTDQTDERLRQAEVSRRENIARLGTIRRKLYDDLMGTLAWVRELVTMIHLAKFTGAPASRAEELVAQIAAAVQGLSEVAQWQDEAVLESA